MIRVLMALVVAIAVAVSVAPSVLAKEIKARLTTPLPVHTSAGEVLTIGWTLGWSAPGSKEYPVDYPGVFVRLKSASGGSPTVGFAAPGSHRDGRYNAQVEVPQGGIGDVQVGLRGTGETFLVENNPFQRQATRTVSSGSQAVANKPPLLVAALVAVLAVLLALGLIIDRHTRAAAAIARR